jgi:OOP family OmpA-OmpF porin
MNVTSLRNLISAFMATGLLLSNHSFGQETNFGNKMPTADQMIDALAPQPRMRGIRPASEMAQPIAVSMELTFEFDSYRLTKDAIHRLDVLADALKSDRLGQYRFRIEGHTDAIGTEEYNKTLSQFRAQAVRDYLITEHGISEARLQSIGLGEENLLNEEDPDSGENRRVVITNLGP